MKYIHKVRKKKLPEPVQHDRACSKKDTFMALLSRKKTKNMLGLSWMCKQLGSEFRWFNLPAPGTISMSFLRKLENTKNKSHVGNNSFFPFFSWNLWPLLSFLWPPFPRVFKLRMSCLNGFSGRDSAQSCRSLCEHQIYLVLQWVICLRPWGGGFRRGTGFGHTKKDKRWSKKEWWKFIQQKNNAISIQD